MQWRKQLEFIFQPFVAATSLREVHRRFESEGGPQGRGYTREAALESEARRLLRALGAEKLAREIRVEWNPRLKTCAGRADYREKLISLNPLLLDYSSSPAENQLAVNNLECKLHSRFGNETRFCDTTSKLECKMHSNFARIMRGASRTSRPPE